MKRKFLTSLVVTLAIFSIPITLGYFYLNQDKLLFMCTSLPEDYKFTFDIKTEELYFSGRKGGKIHALHHTIPSSKGVIVYYHGRGGNLATDWKDAHEEFSSRGYDVIIMDYRGFGKSKGKKSEKTFLSDAQLVYEFAASKYPKEKIVIFGCSFGSGIATYIASKNPCKMLLLKAPYFSLLDVAKGQYPFLPYSILSKIFKYKFKSHKWIDKVKSNIIFFHGKKDTLIPCIHSIKLKSLASSAVNTSMKLYENGSHSNLSYLSHYQMHLDDILK